MILDGEAILKAVKLEMSDDDKKRTGDIAIAMAAAIDDLSLRLRSEGFLRSYDKTVAAGERTALLEGESQDLKWIFAIKSAVNTEHERMLIPVDPQQFLHTYDAYDAEAGYPTYYSVLKSEGGFPVVKFDVPLQSQVTMTVYHFIDMDTNNLAAARSGVAVIAGTKAYFYGTATSTVRSEMPDGSVMMRTGGRGYYEQFKELAALQKGPDTFTPDVAREFTLSAQDKSIRSVANGLRRRV